MRLRALIFALLALVATAALALALAGAATRHVERQTLAELDAALGAGGMDWATSTADGLLVTVSGTAPDEATRLRAIEIARQVASPERVTDTTTAEAPDPLEPPDFALELLRNEAEVSLIGLVPGTEARAVIHEALAAGALDGLVTDMLETADHPAPEGWQESLAFGLDVLVAIPRTKISVAPGQVNVIAVTDSAAARETLEAEIGARRPEGVRLALDISAPRPVIAPFRLDYAWDGETGRFAACTADDEAAVAEILSAARATGLRGPDPDCAIGLGAPSLDWADAVVAGLDTLRDLGGGRFVITDTVARLTGPAGGDAEALNAAGAALAEALPAIFSLETVVLPRMEAGADGQEVYAPRFEAVLNADGLIRLSGAVHDRTSRDAIGSFAAALYGHDKVDNTSVIDPALPDGWPGRVLAGIEALSNLRSGSLTVSPELIRLDGMAVSESEADRMRAFFVSKGAGPVELAIDFDAEAAEALARAAALAARPRPEICAEEIAAILDAGSIGFPAGSSTIDAASSGIIAAIADVLRGCPGARFEVAGHTDSQGRGEVNDRLSTERAEAVKAALDAEDLPLVALTARGYGASVPVADNDSPAGRAQNRRIEITLLSDAPPEAERAQLAPPACAAEIAEMLADGAIQFAPGSTAIADESREVIEAVATTLAACPGAAFEIAGHTDDQGAAEVNLSLSQERADAVRLALEEAGATGVTLTARGYGEEVPVADNDTAEGRALNRRIEMALVESADPAPGEEGAVAATVDGDSAEGCVARVAALLDANPIAFGLGASGIDAGSTATLDEIVAVLEDCPAGTEIEVAGHTDDRGSAEGNLALSRDRAASVRDALAEAGLDGIILTAEGYGEARPIADNETRDGRERNRRIEITLVAAPEPAPAADETDAAAEGDAAEGVAPDAVGETSPAEDVAAPEPGPDEAQAAPGPDGATAETSDGSQ